MTTSNALRRSRLTLSVARLNLRCPTEEPPCEIVAKILKNRSAATLEPRSPISRHERAILWLLEPYKHVGAPSLLRIAAFTESQPAGKRAKERCSDSAVYHMHALGWL